MGFILITVTTFLCISYATLLIHYRKSWKDAKTPKTADPAFQPSIFFSVVVPARNESANIIPCLESILGQQYPSTFFEIIVVDDHSEDDTRDKVIQLKSMQVSLLQLKEQLPSSIKLAHKKKAIEAAVKKARGNWIVTTDADCHHSPYWLLNLAVAIEAERPDMVVMPVRMESTENAIGRFDSLDFLTLQGITGAAVSNNELNMCNGANLAYAKAMFEKLNGYSGIDHISSGDDMLLMEKLADAGGEIIYLKSETVIADTKPSTTIKEFLHQRIRWASKSSAYRDNRIKRILALVYCFNLLLLLSGIDILIENNTLQFGVLSISKSSLWFSILIVKVGAEFAFLKPVSVFFNRQGLMNWFIPMQPFHIVYVVISGFLGLTGNYRWKGRIVK